MFKIEIDTAQEILISEEVFTKYYISQTVKVDKFFSR